MRILAVDPGTKRIGIAISDPSGSIARPLMLLSHIQRSVDAQAILEIALKNEVGKIIIGEALDENGQAGLQARQAAHLADEIKGIGSIPVELWDESNSTAEARRISLTLGRTKKSRKGHQDELAAAVILQSYLDQGL